MLTIVPNPTLHARLTLDESTVRERMRTLIQDGVLPQVRPTRVWARPCREPQPCEACGSVIAARETEFGIVTRAGVIFLHVRCMNLWPA